MIKTLINSALMCAAVAALAATAAFAQDQRTVIESSKLPQSAASVNDFVPAGWKIEEKIVGDLNDDKKADTILKLVEDKASPNKDDMIVERDRALVILFAGTESKYRLAAVNSTLLQCTACGGAFYGVVDAPANVSIEKGVIVIEQEHGSRDVTETTYRFRFDEQPNMFILIGFDYASRDRAAGGVWTESTNYLTGKRITTISKGKKDTSKTTTVAKKRMSLEEVDGDKMDAAATHRLGLD